MGRLPYSEGAIGRTASRCPGHEENGDRGQDNSGGQPRPMSLAERLEEWRTDPDMCLVYAALCTNSPFTLLEGVRLAKTRRKPSAALQVLTGGESGAEGLPGSPHRADSAAAAAAKAAPFHLAGAQSGAGGGLGGRFDSDGASEPSASVPASPSQGPCTSPPIGASASPLLVPRALRSPSAAGAAAIATLQQRVELELAGGCAHHPKPALPKHPQALRGPAQRPPLPEARRRLDAGSGAVVVAPGLAALGAAPYEGGICGDAFSGGFFGRVAEVPLLPWTSSEFAATGLGHRLAKSVHGEVRLLGRLACGSSSSSSSCSRGWNAAVAKVIPNDAVERSRRARETDERRAWLSNGDVPTTEDLTTEIAVLAHLQRSAQERSPHVVRFLGAFQDAFSAYLVTEYCEGGELFERAAYGEPLSEAEKTHYIAQLLLAARHLHNQNVGHRDISLENVLLKNGDCVLVDFGQAVPLRSVDGKPLRYFAEAGKRMYRSPEMYVPRQSVVQVVCPCDAKPGTVAQVSYDKCRCEVLLPPDATPGLPCAAEPCGYEAAPADIFAVGVCAFVLTVGKPPWSVARDADPTFSFVRRHGVPMLLKQWRGGPRPSSAGEESLLAQLLRTEPGHRPNAEECLRAPWLSSALRACTN